MEANGPGKIRRVYERQKTRAGGNWHSHIALLNADGTKNEVVADDADYVVYGYSVQKLYVAMCVLDKIDRGGLVNGAPLTLDTKVTLTAGIIAEGSGIFHLHKGAYGDSITVANFLTAMLLVSDNTSVRLSGLHVPALEINEILAAKGFVHTRVEPVANPNRFYLGVTTPRETHDMLYRLVNGTLLSAASTTWFLRVLRWVNGYHDGVRRDMSSDERSRVATKYGADFNTLGGSRHEAGVMFGTDGSPALTYAMFTDAHPEQNNYGATHPVVQAHSVIGRVLFDSIATTSAPSARTHHTPAPFVPYKGN
ncbi:serine hydrolase [Virgisporangium ochraceum]|uniref:Serine hydrolase n=1 Tax=Virgisporangium ochraceum TaxID=65505 RepID=A0A8J4EBP3_9ACTN|nr:serine hydrolase [Virgisporangium ochraceum]